jgi:hypothetical protein
MRLRSFVIPLALAAAFAVPARASVGPAPVACDDSLNTVFNAGYVACSGPLGGGFADHVEFAGHGAFELVGIAGDASAAFASDPGATQFGALALGSARSGEFVIGIDGGSGHSLYLFDAGAATIAALDFDTFGIARPNGIAGPLLAHAALYVSAVPEPASAALLAAGLASAVGVVRRRRRTL